MFFDSAFSEAGKVSEEKLNVFRSQLAPGSDPAFDYSQLPASTPPAPPAKLVRQARASTERRKVSVDDLAAAQDRCPTGLEQLRRTLRGILDRAEAVEAGAAAGLADSHGGDPGAAVLRARPSRAFLAPSREERTRRDVGARFEELCPVPPVGHYQPQEGLCHPRVVCLSAYGRRPLARSPRLSPTNSCSLNSLTASVSSGDLHFTAHPQSPGIGKDWADLTVARNLSALSDGARNEMPMTGLVKKVPSQRNRSGLRAASVGSLAATAPTGTAGGRRGGAGRPILTPKGCQRHSQEDGAARSRLGGRALAATTASSTLEPVAAAA